MSGEGLLLSEQTTLKLLACRHDLYISDFAYQLDIHQLAHYYHLLLNYQYELEMR